MNPAPPVTSKFIFGTGVLIASYAHITLITAKGQNFIFSLSFIRNDWLCLKKKEYKMCRRVFLSQEQIWLNFFFSSHQDHDLFHVEK